MVGFFNALSAGTFILSCVALYLSVRSATRVAELQRAKRDYGASRISSIETSMQELAVELQHLANRVKMQRVRNTTDHATGASKPKTSADDLPDPYTEPDAWRKAMNAKLGGFPQ